ncbi:glycosyltransferase [Photobacterium carnosum]|uniref:glycosyltransferase family 2 protein n=1 Tax=Photobacterium carnosum TaxID=2023717 RepID=UPI001E53C495|nr:glycosyltransferase family 2 protein [Photobacterium carnosum]MCD9547942.1 glycosyltransferase [Photobacterium carnosum]MCF2305191.1 glycosyltransferase [Photobacterium carnosum]
MISVGIPFFNPGQHFLPAINSILKQTYKDFELILIDDGSTDGSLNIARSISDSRVKVFSDGFNLGLPTRLNQIIDLAQGEYIARMDADDLCSKDRLEKQVKYLNSNVDKDIVSTGICSITEDNKILSYRLMNIDNKKMSIYEVINGNVQIAHATIMVRKSWCLRNKYNEKAKLMEDYQLWIDAFLKNDLNVGLINEPLYFYRENSSIEINKLIKAYGNQIDIVNDNYRKCISKFDFIRFKGIFSAKICISYIFHITGMSNKIISIRNRKTEQDQNIINELKLKIKDVR